MAAPITWRTVQSDSQAAAVSNILEQSRQNLVGGLSGLGGILKDQEGIASRNMASIDEAAKQAYLDQVAAAKTPEELAALQASGALDTARLGLSAASRGAVRGADEARGVAVRANQTAQQQYAAGQRALADAPGREQVKALQAQGKFAEADALTAQLDLVVKSDLLGASRTGARDLELQGRTDKTYADAQDDRRFQLPLTRAAALRGERAGVINANELELTTGDKAASREVDTLVNTMASAHQQNSAAVKAQVDEELMRGGFTVPRNLDGSMNPDLLSDPDKAKIDTYLKGRGLTTLGEIQGGDTAAAVRVREALRARNVKPSDIARVEASIPGMFGTGAVTPIGNDADRISKNTRISAELAASSAMRNGVAATPENIKDLTAAAVEAINQVTQPGTWQREDYMQAAMEFLNSDGITKDGIRVLPGADKLKQMILGAKQSMFTRDTNEIGNQLTGWKESSEAAKGAQAVATRALENQIKALK